MTNDSLPGSSQVCILILKVIPQVYDTTLATGVDRTATIEIGDHDGYDSDHSTGEWGEPDSMVKIDTVPRDPFVPGNLYGKIWNVTWTRDHVWRDYYEVEYDCLKEREVDCVDDEGNPDTCIEEYWDVCTRIEYHEISVTDTRLDSVTITIKAKRNSLTDIRLNYNDTILSTMNDVEDAYSPSNVEYIIDHTDPCLEEAYLSYKNDVFDPDKEDNIKDMSLDGDNYDVKSGWSENYTWIIKPNEEWINGNAPINLFVEFSKAYDDDRHVKFTIANPIILDEQYTGPGLTQTTDQSSNENSTFRGSPGFGVFAVLLGMALVMIWKHRR